MMTAKRITLIPSYVMNGFHPFLCQFFPHILKDFGHLFSNDEWSLYTSPIFLLLVLI